MRVIAVISRRSNSGKTLFLERLARRLHVNDCIVPVVKHVHHGRLTINERKDAERIFLSGANPVAAYAGDTSLILSRGLGVEELLGVLTRLSGMEVVLAEGFKGQAFADQYIYIADSRRDATCSEPGIREKLLLATSLEGPVEACSPTMSFEEAVEYVASLILKEYCHRKP